MLLCASILVICPVPRKWFPGWLMTTSKLFANLREFVDQCSEKYHDEGTADFLTGLMEDHEEMAWMLRSFLEGDRISPSGDRTGQDKVPAKA